MIKAPFSFYIINAFHLSALILYSLPHNNFSRMTCNVYNVHVHIQLTNFKIKLKQYNEIICYLRKISIAGRPLTKTAKCSEINTPPANLFYARKKSECWNIIYTRGKNWSSALHPGPVLSWTRYLPWWVYEDIFYWWDIRLDSASAAVVNALVRNKVNLT